MGEKNLFTFILLWWIFCPKNKKEKLKKTYRYYSAQVMSPSIDMGGVHALYELESSSNNVRYCEEENTWEVFRVGYGKKIHNGSKGEWEIMDLDLIVSFSEKLKNGAVVELHFQA